MTTCGRICCDADGKLNAASVLLEGSRELSKGQVAKLNLNQLPGYSIFPGQIVAVQGSSLGGGTGFAVTKMFGASMMDFHQKEVKRTGLL